MKSISEAPQKALFEALQAANLLVPGTNLEQFQAVLDNIRQTESALLLQSAPNNQEFFCERFSFDKPITVEEAISTLTKAYTEPRETILKGLTNLRNHVTNQQNSGLHDSSGRIIFKRDPHSNAVSMIYTSNSKSWTESGLFYNRFLGGKRG